MVYVCHRAECRGKHEAETCSFGPAQRKRKFGANLNGHDPEKLLIQVFRKVGYITGLEIGANLDVMTREFCQPGHEWGTKVKIEQQQDRLVYMAKGACEEEDPIRRSMFFHRLAQKVIEGDVPEDTQEIGMGPVNLDASMARRHGWSEQQIRRAWEVLRMVAQAEGEIAQANHPHLYKDEHGVSVFVGDDDYYREDEA
jgi:hypothetical protein